LPPPLSLPFLAPPPNHLPPLFITLDAGLTHTRARYQQSVDYWSKHAVIA
jgi:hypothetical protein